MSIRIPIPRHPSLSAEKPTFPDLDKIPEGGLRELKYIVIDGKKIDEKIIYDEKIANFKRLFPTIHQPSFYISYESWQRLIAGKYENDDPWLPDNYEIYAFVFCIIYDNKNHKISFRIRTILKSILSHINLKDYFNNENTPEFSPFRKKNKPKAYIYEPELEIGNIAHVDWEIAKSNDSDGTNDCLRFIRETEGSERSEINEKVRFWKSLISGGVHLESWNYLLKSKDTFGIFNRNPIQDLPKPDIINPAQNIKPQIVESEQEGVIFSKQKIKSIIDKYQKGTKIDFALDFLEDAPKDTIKAGYYHPFKFVFNVNPAYVTDGLPCPTPPVCE